MLQFKRDKVSEHIRVYHSKFVLSDKKVELGLPGEAQTLQEGLVAIATLVDEDGNKMPVTTLEIENTILQTIVDIPGVELAVIHPYSIQVYKAKAYEWGPIEHRVLILLGSLHQGLEFCDNKKPTNSGE